MRRKWILAAALLAAGSFLCCLAWRSSISHASAPGLEPIESAIETARAPETSDIESVARDTSPLDLRETRTPAALGAIDAGTSDSPILRVRVVDAEGQSMSGANLEFAIAASNVARPTVVHGLSGSDGRFTEASRIPLDCKQVHVDVSFSDRWAKQSYDFTAPDPLPQIWDVGDLKLDATLRLTVSVVDSLRVPIATALISLPGSSGHVIRTDGSGLATVTIQVSVSEFEVSAPGFYPEVAYVPLHADETTIVEVTLDPTCNLNISVAPAPPPGVQVTIELTCSPNPSPQSPPRRGSNRFFAAPSLDVPANGEIVWTNVRPGVDLRAEVKSLGVVVASLDIAPMRLGESRFELLSLDASPSPLAVSVVGPSGEPVVNAFVRLTLNSRECERALWTDNWGRGTVLIYRPAVVDVKVHADGYAERELIQTTLRQDSLQIELERERVVFVSVVDANGQPDSSSNRTVCARVQSRAAIVGERIDGNVWRLSRLPAGEVVIAADGGSSMLHDTSIPNATLVVGAAGDVWASFDVDAKERSDRWSVFARSLTNPSYSTRAFDGRMGDAEKVVPLTDLPCGRYEMQVQHLLDAQRGRWEPWSEFVIVAVGTKRVDLNLTR